MEEYVIQCSVYGLLRPDTVTVLVLETTGETLMAVRPAVSVIVTVPPELLMLTVLPLLSLTEEGYDKTALTPLFPVILKLENEYTVPSL